MNSAMDRQRLNIIKELKKCAIKYQTGSIKHPVGYELLRADQDRIIKMVLALRSK